MGDSVGSQIGWVGREGAAKGRGKLGCKHWVIRVSSPVPMAASGCLKQPRGVLADSVGLEQPHEGCLLFIPLLSQHLEEEKAVHASVQNSQPEQQEIYANVPSAPRPREEPGSAVQ